MESVSHYFVDLLTHSRVQRADGNPWGDVCRPVPVPGVGIGLGRLKRRAQSTHRPNVPEPPSVCIATHSLQRKAKYNVRGTTEASAAHRHLHGCSPNTPRIVYFAGFERGERALTLTSTSQKMLNCAMDPHHSTSCQASGCTFISKSTTPGTRIRESGRSRIHRTASRDCTSVISARASRSSRILGTQHSDLDDPFVGPTRRNSLYRCPLAFAAAKIWQGMIHPHVHYCRPNAGSCLISEESVHASAGVRGLAPRRGFLVWFPAPPAQRGPALAGGELLRTRWKFLIRIPRPQRIWGWYGPRGWICGPRLQCLCGCPLLSQTHPMRLWRRSAYHNTLWSIPSIGIREPKPGHRQRTDR